MKKKTSKFIICICLFMMLFTNFSNLFAMTNPEYVPKVTVTENALDSKIKSSVLLDALANMINAVASLAEWLIGNLFQALTGDNIFPWADRIIFNGIGFLDINFLNPADNSLFIDTKSGDGSDSILGEVIVSVYSTIFSLAVLFLGVAVGIMAIRLAISSIASEKAKYKQAIVNWSTCIVMLFLMHYILAFVFWVNEQMVEIASSILIKTIEDRGLNSVNFQDALDAVLQPEERVNNYLESIGPNVLNVTGAHTSYIKIYTDIANRLLTNEEYVSERMVFAVDNGRWDIDPIKIFAKIGADRLDFDVATAKNISDLSEEERESGKSAGKITTSIDGKPSTLFFTKEAYLASDEYKTDKRMYENLNSARVIDLPMVEWGQALGFLFNAEDSIKVPFADTHFDTWGNSQTNRLVNFRLKVDRWIYDAAMGKTSSEPTDIIASLGSFFKQSAYVYTAESTTTDEGGEKQVITGWRATKLSVTGALLYAIFIFQSFIYLVMYVKRLFYVIMLAMFGPIVVIYDFFMKSAAG